MNISQAQEPILVVDENYTTTQLLNDLRTTVLPVGIDVETEGIDPRTDAAAAGKGRIVCWSISLPSEGSARGLAQSTSGSDHRIPLIGNRIFLREKHLGSLKSWLEDPSKGKVGHNLFGFDRHMFANHGINLRGIIADTLACSRLCNNRPEAKHGLKDLMKYRLGYEPIGEFKKLFVEREIRTCSREAVRKSVRRGIPTTLGTEWSELGATRPTSISAILSNPEHPLRKTLIAYATLDAKATVELYLNHFLPELEGTDYL